MASESFKAIVQHFGDICFCFHKSYMNRLMPLLFLTPGSFTKLVYWYHTVTLDILGDGLMNSSKCQVSTS